jgi:phytoene synthase
VSDALAAKLPTNWEAANPERDWHRNPSLRGSFEHCHAITRQHARSFYFSSFPLPEAKKQAAFAIYAFCRHIDDCIDAAPDGAEVPLPTRQKLSADLEAMEAGRSDLPFAPAFAEVNRQYSIPRDYYLDLIAGCCADRGSVDIANFAELELYCYQVASVVGLMMSKVFGLRDAEGASKAIAMGTAMQLTNILRDVGEDFAMGRIYLPRDEREAFGITPEVLRRGENGPAWQAFVKMQIARARDYYERGEKGLALLPDDGSRLTARLMAEVYGGILGAIERADYDVFSRRCFVSTWRKLGTAFRLLLARP